MNFCNNFMNYKGTRLRQGLTVPFQTIQFNGAASNCPTHRRQSPRVSAVQDPWFIFWETSENVLKKCHIQEVIGTSPGSVLFVWIQATSQWVLSWSESHPKTFSWNSFCVNPADNQNKWARGTVSWRRETIRLRGSGNGAPNISQQSLPVRARVSAIHNTLCNLSKRRWLRQIGISKWKTCGSRELRGTRLLSPSKLFEISTQTQTRLSTPSAGPRDDPKHVFFRSRLLLSHEHATWTPAFTQSD